MAGAQPRRAKSLAIVTAVAVAAVAASAWLPTAAADPDQCSLQTRVDLLRAPPPNLSSRVTTLTTPLTCSGEVFDYTGIAIYTDSATCTSSCTWFFTGQKEI